MYMPVSSREEVTERSSLWLDFLGVGLRGRQRQGKGWSRLLPDRQRQDRGSDDPLHGGAEIELESFGRRAQLSDAWRTSANFVELRNGEVRRILLLRRRVNEGSPKLRMASRGGRRGLLRAQTPCAAIWRARQRPTEPEGAPRGLPAPGRAAGHQESPPPAQPRCRRDTWGPRCRV
jgi:hypothetical protein